MKREEGRGGKRKPIVEEEEEDVKKDENVEHKAADLEAKEEDDAKKPHEEKIIRAPQTQAVTKILAEHNTTMNQSKGAAHTGNVAGQSAEVAAKSQKKLIVRKETTSLFLQNNELSSINNLYTVLHDVMWNHHNLQWIDLSYNHLTEIELEILNFPCLKVLYLHGNEISNLEECRKLQNLHMLQTLTLYGNRIEQIKGYRMWVLGVMYQKSENLKKFDQVVVTRQEFDSVIVWNEYTHKTGAKKLQKLKPPQRNDAPAETEEAGKKTASK